MPDTAPNDFAPIAQAPSDNTPTDFGPTEPRSGAIPPAFIDRVSQGEAARQSFEEQSKKPYSQRLAEWSAQKIKEGSYGQAALGGVSSFIASGPEAIAGAFQMGKDAWDNGLVGPGLRREDFTDIPGKGQPGDEDYGKAFNAAFIFGPHAGRPLMPDEAGSFSRLKPDPVDGTMRKEPVGPLPEAQDFHNAATVLSPDEVAPQVLKKLERIWDEHGVTPSEIAHDAQTDPVLKQEVLSRDDKLPAVYGEETAEAEGAGKPPAPPEEPPGKEMSAAGEPPEGGKPMSVDDARDKILEHISVDQASSGKGITLAKIYTNVVDRFFPISKARDGAEFAAAEDPYKLARLFSGWTGKADHMLNEGTFDFNTYKPNGPPLKEILDPIKGEMDDFRAFVSAAHAKELERLGIETGFDKEAIQVYGESAIGRFGPELEKLVTYQRNVAQYLRDSGVISDKGFAAMTDKYSFYVPFHRVMGEDMMAGANGISGQSMQASNPIKALVGSELKVVDPIENIIKNTYLFTAMAEKNFVGTKLIDMLEKQGAAKEELSQFKGKQDKGDAADIAGFLEHEGAKADPDLISSLQDMATPPKPGEISIFRDGKRISYKVDPDIANAMKGLDRSTTNWFIKLLEPLSSTLRAGAVLDPEFAIRHTIRDFIYSFIKTNDGVYTPADSLKGLVGLITKDADYWKWQQGGGANATLVGLDRRFLQESLSELNDKSGLMARSWNVIQNPNMTPLSKISSITGQAWQSAISPLQMLTEFAMNMNHLGGFKRSLRDLESKTSEATGTTLPALTPQGGAMQLRDGVTWEAGQAALDAASRATGADKKNILEAAWVSRNTGIDIARMGAKMKSWNAISAFMNAKIQDTMQIAEALAKTPVSTGIKIGVGITIPSLALWWANKDDSRYQELPEWEKDVFWVIPTDRWEPSPEDLAKVRPRDQWRLVDGQYQVNNGTIWRIPKPFSTGVLFGSGAERIAEHFYNQNPDAFKGFIKSLSISTVGDITPNALVPMFEQMANRSFFTNRTIIPARLEGQLPEYQYSNYTTETAKKLGQVLSSFSGISQERVGQAGSMGHGTANALSSPMLIENYIRGWTGALGTYTLQAADYGLRQAGVVPPGPEHAEKTMADIPIVRAFVARYPTTNAQSVQNFYEKFNENKIYFDTYMARANEGDQESMDKIQAAGGMRMFVQLDAIKQAITEQSQVIQMVDKNPDMKPFEKRQLIDSLYYGLIQTAKEGNDVLNQVGK